MPAPSRWRAGTCANGCSRWASRRRSTSRRAARGLILFAWATWIYRLVLFLGIAALVYHFFIKALGIFLFLVEIVWFIARPLWSEIGAWRQRGAAIGGSRRARWSALLLILIVLGAFAPWPVPVRGSGLLQAREQWPLHAPEASRLASPRRPRARAAGP